METAKQKIRAAVSEYKRLFTKEYNLFLKSHQVTIDKQNDKWGSTGKGSKLVERHLFDTPEKLYNAIQAMLTNEEKDWWAARGAHIKDFSAAKWFISEFPEFKVTKDF
jgi:hypothetical protein